MDNREIVIRAFGEGQFYITDDRTERVLDAGYDDVSRKQYGSALTAMLKEVSRAVLEENPEQNYLQDEDTGKVTSYRQAHRGISRLEILIAGIAALAAGGITAGGIIGAYRFKSGSYQYPIEKNGSVRLEKKKIILSTSLSPTDISSGKAPAPAAAGKVPCTKGPADAAAAAAAENFKKRLHFKNKYANIFPVSTDVFCRHTKSTAANRRRTWKKRQNILF